MKRFKLIQLLVALLTIFCLLTVPPVNAQHRIEKVYIQFDKPFYLVGDNCWYKAYVVDGTTLFPTALSQVLYVDWFSPDGQLRAHQQLKLRGGEAHGDFAFYSNAPHGMYTVRAYTNWMRNDGADYFFSASLPLFNPFIGTERVVGRVTQPEPDVQFFPEGGRLINGIPSKVAFKALGPDGKGIDVSGSIIDDSEIAVTEFKSSHKGMGVFLFTPAKGRSYRAQLTTGIIVPLPTPDDSGVALFVNNLGAENLRIQVQSSGVKKGARYFIVGQSRGQIYKAELIMDKPTMDITIPKSGMLSGIMQLTLLDSAYSPRCERIAFINGKEKLKIHVQPDKPSYKGKEEIKLKVMVTDPEGQPVKTNLSVAVTNSQFAIRDNKHENILTRLLLQSDLKGVIEDPGWYLEADDPSREYGLDLVMMTHGWRRFNWDAVRNDSLAAPQFRAEKGLTTKGLVIKNENNKPLSRGKISLVASGSGYSGVYSGETDEHGRFHIDDVDFTDSTTQIWKTEAEKGRLIDASIKLEENEVPPFTDSISNPLTMEKNASVENFQNRFRNTTDWNFENVQILQEVEIKETRLSNQLRGNLPGKAVLLMPSKRDFQTSAYGFILQYAPKIAFAYQVTTRTGNLAWGKPGRLGKYQLAHVLIDGAVIVGDPDSFDPPIDDSISPFAAISSVPIEDIDHVIASDMFVSIVTKKKGHLNPTNRQPGLGLLKLFGPGYNVPREFYHPKYLPSDTVKIPDNRIALYWNPNLETDDEGVGQITLYNSDNAKEFQVVAEGLADGLLGTVAQKFTIDPARAKPGTLSGRVVEAKTGKPVPFASVFLAKTMIGAMAKEDGTYVLQNVPPGKYDVTASSIGYKIASVPTVITQGSTLDIRIDQESQVLNEIVIEGKNNRRPRYVTIFKKHFLGNTMNASNCKIKNLDDIDFVYNRDSALLSASCPQPIEVENYATGYRLFYLLTEFKVYTRGRFYKVSTKGIPRFEAMMPKDDQEKLRWGKERDRAYHGSMIHLMKSLTNGTASDNRFAIYIRQKGSDTDRVEGNDDFRLVDDSYVVSNRIDSLNTLKIVYSGEMPDWNYPVRVPSEVSFIRFHDKPLVSHNNGYFDNFGGFDVDGYMGWAGGIAELVPLEYQPSTTEK